MFKAIMMPSYQPLVFTDKLFIKSKNALTRLKVSVMLLIPIMRDTLNTTFLAVRFVRHHLKSESLKKPSVRKLTRRITDRYPRQSP